MKNQILKSIFLFLIFINLNLPCKAELEKEKIKVINDWRNRYDYTFTDENGNFRFHKELKRFYGFNDGYATVVVMDWDYAILDENGNISERRFEMLGQKFSEGKNFAMFKDLTTGVIDTKGSLLFKIDIADIDGALAATPFFNGRALIKKSENLWHMIDDKGNKLKEFNIFYAYPFCGGLSKIQFRHGAIREYNYINSDGDFISPVNFDDARDFEDGRALVKIGEESFYIGTDGRRLSE